jgi:hypothetical protein
MPAPDEVNRFIHRQALSFSERLLAAAELWGFTPRELAEVQRSLAEVQGR